MVRSLRPILPALVSLCVAEAAHAEEPSPFTLGAYVEAFYQWNFADPSNGLTNFRGFDNRHDAFTVSNVALDLGWDRDSVVGRVALQIGHTPSTYYLAEPDRPGGSGANGSDGELWKYVQQAYAGYRFPRDVLVTAGVYLSPIGPESIAVKDNWNLSRSNLFFGLPFYHTGVRVAVPVSEAWTLELHGCNGWNSVVDNNREKSVMLHGTYAEPDRLALSFLYFAGVERPSGAPEGRPFRHLFDAHATIDVLPRLAILGHADAGFEPNDFGTSWWSAGALGLRVRALPTLFVVARGDVFYEKAAENAMGAAARIFWPVEWVSSATVTFDYRPKDHVSLRLEYRHDHTDGDLFFAGDVAGDGTAVPFVPNRRYQDTVTVGITSWL